MDRLLAYLLFTGHTCDYPIRRRISEQDSCWHGTDQYWTLLHASHLYVDASIYNTHEGMSPGSVSLKSHLRDFRPPATSSFRRNYYLFFSTLPPFRKRTCPADTSSGRYDPARAQLSTIAYSIFVTVSAMETIGHPPPVEAN